MEQKIHTFKAETLDEAYRKMRRKLGPGAVVLSTAETKEGGILGWMAKPVATVTAAAALPTAASGPAPVTGKTRRPSSVERKYMASRSGAPKNASDSTGQTPESLAYFEKLVHEAKTRIAQREAAKPAATAAASSHVVPFAQIEEEDPAKDGLPEAVDNVRRDVQTMNETLNLLVAETAGAGPHADFTRHFRRLVSQGVSRQTAAAIVAEVARGGNAEKLRDPRLFRERMKFQIRRQVSVTGGITLTPGRCHAVALVGPTGVGKTTNLAKLAAEFAVRERVEVALITCDTYRIAAPEQLRVYANIIGLPMRVVNDAREMDEAMAAFRDYDLILIDTAGSSQFNASQIEELRDTLRPARPNETMLLLSANTQLHELHNAIASFRCLNPTSLLFTKLDEVAEYGVLLSLCLEADLPLSYLSIGQDVPNDIEIANPGRVANLIVEGGENCDRSSTKSA